jgi:hypothetical protein
LHLPGDKDIEKKIFDKINEVRTSPVEYGKTNLCTDSAADSLKESCLEFSEEGTYSTGKHGALSKLEWNDGLYLAAKWHIEMNGE